MVLLPYILHPMSFSHLPHLNLISGKTKSWPELLQGSIPQSLPSLPVVGEGGSQIPHYRMAHTTVELTHFNIRNTES